MPAPAHIGRNVLVIGVSSATPLQDEQYPGQVDGCGWGSDGSVFLQSTTAFRPGSVKFCKGDWVILALDCRAGPLVRILVNGQLCLEYPMHNLSPDATLHPALSLPKGAKVELKPLKPLKPGDSEPCAKCPAARDGAWDAVATPSVPLTGLARSIPNKE